ncbi:MAG: hypothetical protein AAF493_01755 [Pseudomonadota bacterium]
MASGALLILDYSGEGSLLAQSAFDMHRWSTITLLGDGDDAKPWRYAGTLDRASQHADACTDIAVAHRNNRDRLALLNTWKETLALATVVNPSAAVSRFAALAPGVVVLADAVVNISAALDVGTLVHERATVDHDCNLHAGALIDADAHLAGGVSVGECATVGHRANVIQGVAIGADAWVDAHSAVIRDVPDGGHVAGVPAKVR